MKEYRRLGKEKRHRKSASWLGKKPPERLVLGKPRGGRWHGKEGNGQQKRGLEKKKESSGEPGK